MSERSGGGGASIGLPGLLFLLFLGLKLAGVGQVATWSWWWVTSPLWISAGLFLVGMAAALVVFGIAVFFDRKR